MSTSSAKKSAIRRQYQATTRRRRWVLGLIVVALFVVFVMDVMTGPGNYSPMRVLAALFGVGEPDLALKIVVWDIRLPIALMAILVGAMLAASGAQMQTILNNPLAEPFTLGISFAAAFGAALVIVLGVGVQILPVNLMISLSAFVFSFLTACLLYFFARLRGASSETMVLIGIALLFTFNALLYLLQYVANDTQLSQIVFWMMGSLTRANWEKVGLCALVLVLVIPFFMFKSWALTALRLGDERASALGVSVNQLRMQVLFGVSLLAATAVAFSGTIMFVGLVGPHIARMLVGEDQRYFLPTSVACGALMMSLTSLVSKSVTPGVVYPVSIVTSLIGVPFFISLVLSSKRRSWS